MNDTAKTLTAFGCVLVFLAAFWILCGFMRARAFESLTGRHISTWDAMFIELRAARGSAMSGGSWDYLYAKVEEAAERLDPDPLLQPPERREFGKLLRLVALALHHIEWVDSCDMARGEEVPAIEAALNFRRSQ